MEVNFITILNKNYHVENEIISLLKRQNFSTLNQWSSRCAAVHTSVHENYFTVSKKKCKKKKKFK